MRWQLLMLSALLDYLVAIASEAALPLWGTFEDAMQALNRGCNMQS